MSFVNFFFPPGIRTFWKSTSYSSRIPLSDFRNKYTDFFRNGWQKNLCVPHNQVTLNIEEKNNLLFNKLYNTFYSLVWFSSHTQTEFQQWTHTGARYAHTQGIILLLKFD